MWLVLGVNQIGGTTVKQLHEPVSLWGEEAHLQGDDLVLGVAKQARVEAQVVLTDVQAALQEYLLPQRAHELVTHVLQRPTPRQACSFNAERENT